MLRSADGDQLLARRRNDLTRGEFEQPFSDFLIGYTFTRIELGFGFSDRSDFLVGINERRSWRLVRTRIDQENAFPDHRHACNIARDVV